MARKAYAKRYAQAVFQIALTRQELDKWHVDLRKIVTVTEDAAFTALLENPKLHFADKAKLLSERLGDINPLALNLVYLLIARGRLSMVSEITDEYQRLLNSYRGIEEAEIMTAVPMDEEDKRGLEDGLQTVVGKKVIIKPKVNPGLIGGMVARIGGKLIDGSTRNRLEALKKELSGAGR